MILLLGPLKRWGYKDKDEQCTVLGNGDCGRGGLRVLPHSDEAAPRLGQFCVCSDSNWGQHWVTGTPNWRVGPMILT